MTPNDELLLQDGTSDVAFACVLQDFARAIEEGTEPAVSAVDGLRAVEIIEAAARAAQDRCLVDLPLNHPYPRLQLHVKPIEGALPTVLMENG